MDTMDATFGTNVSKYSFFSLLVFDDWKIDIAITWIFNSRVTKENLIMWLEPLRRHFHRDKENFFPSCFIVDDVDN